jgi:hypothetical protein
MHSQRTSRVIAALPVLATTFVMHAMVGRRNDQLKMPRPDANAPTPVRPEAVEITEAASLRPKPEKRRCPGSRAPQLASSSTAIH